MWPFEPAEESLCFLRGLLELMTEAKNINIRYIFDVKSRIIAKCGSCSEEIAGRLKNNSLWQTNVSRVLYVKFQIEKRWLVKHFSFLKNVCYQYLNVVRQVTYCFFTSCWLAHNQLSLNVLLLHVFPVIRLVNFV